MKIIYSAQAKEQLNQIKSYISKDNPKITINYLLKIKNKIELLGKYPYIGKINSVYNLENIREFNLVTKLQLRNAYGNIELKVCVPKLELWNKGK